MYVWVGVFYLGFNTPELQLPPWSSIASSCMGRLLWVGAVTEANLRRWPGQQGGLAKPDRV